MYKPVFCICQSIGQTAAIVNNLKMAGFSNNEISLLFSESANTETPLKNPGENGASAEENRLDLEWISGIASLEIPGSGRFVAGGPIVVELSRTPKKDSVVDLMTALVGVGIPGQEAKHYQEKIKSGLTLIVVNTANVDTRDSANTIFRQADAQDISSSEEVSVIV